MIQQQRQRVEHAVTEMIDEVDKSHLRKLQIDMYNCSAKCCQDMNASTESVARCIDRCSLPVTKAQSYVQHELGEFQGRLQRCIMQCNDDIKIKMPADPNDDDVAKFGDQFDRCAIKCVDKHVGLIPTMMKTMKAVLAKGSDGIPQF